jgi:hypothetical protein
VDPVAPTIAILPLLLPTATAVAITNILKISKMIQYLFNELTAVSRLIEQEQQTDEHKERKKEKTDK